ncbi:MAG TPA: hypothetical protein VLV83_19570 [Acidobacteriota bacterium]|nr:hypothetical protein [Acidobacteriota bacterium]
MSLQEKLDEYKAGFKKKAPQAAQDVMIAATQDLIDSGRAEEARGQGDRLPHFQLPNTNGESVRSQELLKQGPLVVSIYRGVW